jgi:hypothetical protein
MNGQKEIILSLVRNGGAGISRQPAEFWSQTARRSAAICATCSFARMWVSLYKDRRRKPGAQGPMHGSSACIAPDGKVLFATAEGRLSTHDSRFPLMAIEGEICFAWTTAGQGHSGEGLLRCSLARFPCTIRYWNLLRGNTVYFTGNRGFPP